MTAEHQLADSAAMIMITKSIRFDVVATESVGHRRINVTGTLGGGNAASHSDQDQ